MGDSVLNWLLRQCGDDVVQPGQVRIRGAHMHARKPQLCRIHCRHLAQACLAMSSYSVLCIFSAWLFTFYPYGIRLFSILTST